MMVYLHSQDIIYFPVGGCLNTTLQFGGLSVSKFVEAAVN